MKRASRLETAKAIQEWAAKQTKKGCSGFDDGCCCEDCVSAHCASGSGCRYGQACGEDDYINECDCKECCTTEQHEKKDFHCTNCNRCDLRDVRGLQHLCEECNSREVYL